MTSKEVDACEDCEKWVQYRRDNMNSTALKFDPEWLPAGAASEAVPVRIRANWSDELEFAEWHRPRRQGPRLGLQRGHHIRPRGKFCA